MTHASRVDGLQKTRNELSARIKKTDLINQKFKNSFAGYTEDTVGQKVTVFFLGILVLALLIFSPMIVSRVFNMVGAYNGSGLQTLGIVAMYAICIYVALFMLRIIIRLSRIARIDGYVAEVNAIRTKLNTNLGAVDTTLTKIEKEIQAKNVKITPVDNIDEEITNYENIANTYSNPDGDALDGIIKFAYWAATILFGVAFVAITGTAVASSISSTFDVDVYGVVLFFYAVFALAGFIALHVAISKNQEEFGFGTFILSLFSGPVAVPVIWAICGLIALVLYLLSIALVIAIVVGIIAALCNS